MCGIFGWVGHADRHLAERCLTRLEHRGPDGWGLWYENEITLGHRRLAILDLTEAGHQPMKYALDRFVITFNGEIYNFLELRHELVTNGFVFHTETDTEVILAAYLHWGARCLDKFNGMWAFAIWDRLEKNLFLARDRFGKKPLFYTRQGDRFAFASEMKALFPLLPRLEPSHDFAWIQQHIFSYETTDKCLIEGIKRFPSGHYGILNNGALSLHRYWNTLDHLVTVPSRYEDQVEEFRELFLDACRLRMRSDVPIGTALSGGLDSSAVACTMAHLMGGKASDRSSSDWQHAFVATFPGTPLDERQYAEEVVRHTGIRPEYVEIDPRKDIDKLEWYFYQFEELSPTPPIPMIQLYQAMKERGVSVTLDGHGVDELFVGYPYLMFESGLSAGVPLAELAEVYRGMMPSDSGQFRELRSDMALYLRFSLRRMAKAVLGRRITSGDVEHPAFRSLGVFNQYLYVLTHQTILPTLLRNYDRYAMINGVEIRMPFMDHRLVSYAMSLPMQSKNGAGFTKRIVRDALGRYMPESITRRKTKIGFMSPMVNWMQGPMRTFLLDHINSEAFKTSSLVDAASVANKVKSVINGKNIKFSAGTRAWEAFMPYLWERALLQRRYEPRIASPALA